MARVIYTVNATQVVVSEQNPQGIVSTVSGFPKVTDSRDYANNYRGAETAARVIAEADFYAGVKTLTTANNPNRVAWTVTMERSDGRQMLREHYGDFPAEVQPEPEPEPEEPVEGEQ